MSKSIGIYCPHCGTRMRTNGRKRPSPVLHKLIVVCPNHKCMASFNAHIEIVSCIQESFSPNPEIKGSIRTLHPWFIELEYQVQSIEQHPNPSQEQIIGVKGFISGLQFCNVIDFSEAQEYTRRIAQLQLFTTDTQA